MEKRAYLLFLVLIFATQLTICKCETTGNTIIGKATSQPFNVSVFILPSKPIITILSPLNRTYLTNTSLLLNYTESLADYIWYKIDSGINISTTSPIYFDVSQGSHILYLYANNTNNETSADVSFTANSTRFIILYEEYKGASKGNSTNFSIIITYEELQEQSNITLENTNYGKILFLESINLTNDKIPDDNMLDLDSNTNISSNRIELNETALPNFNVSATLWLYNLTFTNPRILLNGAVCSICTEENYSSNILKFNATGFSGNAVFSAEETPTGCPPGTTLCSDGLCKSDCGGGPGGPGECSNDCSQAGQKNTVCINGTSLAITTCGQYDNDTCLDWSQLSYESCTLGYECRVDKCEYVGECTENWQCGNWSSCVDNIKTAVCKDMNGCYPDRTQTQPCESQPGNCSIYFQNGWNFISLCSQIEDTKINNALKYIAGLYDYILEWDESKQEFKVWSSKGAKQFDSFDPKKSYFIFYQGPTERVNLTGPLYDDLNVDLLKGWNSPVYPYEFSTKITGNEFYNTRFYYMQDWDRQMQSFKVYSINSTQPGFNTVYAGNGILILTDKGVIEYRRTTP